MRNEEWTIIGWVLFGSGALGPGKRSPLIATFPPKVGRRRFFDMPTAYHASLDHRGFDWSKDVETIKSKLLERGDLLIAKLRFAELGGCTCQTMHQGSVAEARARFII